MNESKTIEILSKRNAALCAQLEELKSQSTEESKEKLSSLIKELEELRTIFIQSIKELKKSKKIYDGLNMDLIQIKKEFSIFKIPWYKKIFHR